MFNKKNISSLLATKLFVHCQLQSIEVQKRVFERGTKTQVFDFYI